MNYLQPSIYTSNKKIEGGANKPFLKNSENAAGLNQAKADSRKNTGAQQIRCSNKGSGPNGNCSRSCDCSPLSRGLTASYGLPLRLDCGCSKVLQLRLDCERLRLLLRLAATVPEHDHLNPHQSQLQLLTLPVSVDYVVIGRSGYTSLKDEGEAPARGEGKVFVSETEQLAGDDGREGCASTGGEAGWCTSRIKLLADKCRAKEVAVSAVKGSSEKVANFLPDRGPGPGEEGCIVRLIGHVIRDFHPPP